MAGAGNPAQISAPPIGPAAPSGVNPDQNTNAFQQAAQGVQMAGQGTIASGMGPNIQAFENPYTQQVIDRTQQDIERQRQMATNTLGAQASQAGAFGGSRQGVAESLTNESFARQAADTLAQQRQQGFNTALGAAQNQQDVGLRASGQLADISNLGFGQAMDITRQQQQQGLAMQALNQQIIDAARQQYAGFTGAPERALQLPISAVSAGNMNQGTTTGTTQQQPGLLNYLSLGASLASDPRLKTNIKLRGERGGVKFYTWDWNDEGKRIADPSQPTAGVLADELQETHPHLVHKGSDGYLRVNYAGLAEAIGAAV